MPTTFYIFELMKRRLLSLINLYNFLRNLSLKFKNSPDFRIFYNFLLLTLRSWTLLIAAVGKSGMRLFSRLRELRVFLIP